MLLQKAEQKTLSADHGWGREAGEPPCLGISGKTFIGVQHQQTSLAEHQLQKQAARWGRHRAKGHICSQVQECCRVRAEGYRVRSARFGGEAAGGGAMTASLQKGMGSGPSRYLCPYHTACINVSASTDQSGDGARVT